MTPTEARVILTFLADTIEREAKTTAKVLAALPAGHDEYCPDQKCKPALELAWHIAASEQMFLVGVAEGAFDPGRIQKPEGPLTGADIAAWYRAESAKNI